MRGIVPRLVGVGYNASFSSFVTALTYNILLGMSINYLINSGNEPWAAKNFDPTRTLSCQTAAIMQKPSEEIYLFTKFVKLYGDNYCEVYLNGDPSSFSMPLFWSNFFLLVFLFLGSIDWTTSYRDKIYNNSSFKIHSYNHLCH